MSVVLKELATEVWYVIENAWKGSDDWSADGTQTWDSPNSCRKVMQAEAKAHREYDYRIVRKTLHSEVIA